MNACKYLFNRRSIKFFLLSVLFLIQCLSGYDHALVCGYGNPNLKDSVAQKVVCEKVFGGMLEALGDLGIVTFFESGRNKKLLGLFVIEDLSEEYELATLHSMGKNVQVNSSLSLSEVKAIRGRTALSARFKENPQYRYAMKLDVLELYDAQIRTGNLWKIEGLDNLKILGLPRHGVHFDELFVLPKMIDTLVVRNSILNRHFFEALSELNELKTLILIDCHLDAGVPSIWEFGEDDEWYLSYPSPFGYNLIQKVERLRVVGGTFPLLTNVLAGPWPNLIELNVREIEPKQYIKTLVFANRLDVFVRKELADSNGVIARLFPSLTSFSFERTAAKRAIP